MICVVTYKFRLMFDSKENTYFYQEKHIWYLKKHTFVDDIFNDSLMVDFKILIGFE